MEFGGVLEHPASSNAWNKFGLQKPTFGEWIRIIPGEGREYWVTEVWQSAYGHRARKRTWLLYAGDRHPEACAWNKIAGTHQCGWFDRKKPTLSKREASATPEDFAKFLIRLALNSKV
jgi:hypothetical protein